ncbi:ribonuclease P protein subunit p30 isoform X3 [Castor canadensis]|uniref:Ribonuclease P protein subunit p30 isoform X3 n=1 Tax=Castor canadensis TaxID=51338 RepID=A0AC58MZZ1_CASCN
MAVFADLDLKAGSDLKALRGLVETAAHLGYSVVAINHVIDFKEKKQEIEKPVAVSELFTTLPVVQGKSKPIKILTRLTIIVTDPSHCNVLRATSSRVRLYDIVAVFPKTEKLFHVACTHLDVDLVCITVTEKLPFYFKRPPINVAIERGLGFELVYSPAIKDSTMRRYTISNALNLMQICKGKVWEERNYIQFCRKEGCCLDYLRMMPRLQCPQIVEQHFSMEKLEKLLLELFLQ